MATLAEIVARGIPLVYRIKYDFTFWIPQVNEVVKLITKMAILPENTQEYGVAIKGGRWINIPVKCRRPVDVYNFVDENAHYPFSLVNNRIKLKDNVDSSAAIPCSLVWVDSKHVIIESVSLVTATTYIGRSIIDSAGYVHGILAAATVGSDTVLTLQYDVTDTYNIVPTYPDPGDSPIPFTGEIILTDDCYMIKGIFDYPDVVTAYDEVPLSDKYESAIVTGLRLAIQKEQEDTTQIGTWMQLLQWEMGMVKMDEGSLKKVYDELGIQPNATQT